MIDEEAVEEAKQAAREAVMALYRDITYDYAPTHLLMSMERASEAVARFVRLSTARTVLERRKAS